MTIYDLREARGVILSNVQTDCSNQLQLDLISILVNFSYALGQIGESFKKKVQSGTKNVIRFYIALNWGEKLQTW